jgi:hypothetical protein
MGGHPISSSVMIRILETAFGIMKASIVRGTGVVIAGYDQGRLVGSAVPTTYCASDCRL